MRMIGSYLDVLDKAGKDKKVLKILSTIVFVFLNMIRIVDLDRNNVKC